MPIPGEALFLVYGLETCQMFILECFGWPQTSDKNFLGQGSREYKNPVIQPHRTFIDV